MHSAKLVLVIPDDAMEKFIGTHLMEMAVESGVEESMYGLFSGYENIYRYRSNKD